MAKKPDLVGQKFGRLTVKKDSGDRRQGKVLWDCDCACGGKAKPTTSNLKNGNTRSCGCINKERMFDLVYKDGRSYDPDYNLRLRLQNHYNLTLEEYYDMFFRQEGKCQICKKEFIDQYKSINIDHCHKSGKVRSLLCPSCNVGLGCFKEDITLMKYAIEYIDAHTQ